MTHRGRVRGEGYWKDVYATEFGSETGGSSADNCCFHFCDVCGAGDTQKRDESTRTPALFVL